MEHSLQIDSVIKHFDTKKILSDIYLELKTTEIIGIHGRNGVGKSTLFNIIYGIEKADQALIKHNHTAIKKPFKIKDLIAYSSQKCFLPKITLVEDLLQLFVCDECIDECLTIFKPILKSKVTNLSGGEQKMLQNFLILNSNAKFILLDEPFSKISPIMVDKLSQLIIKKSKSKGILICDHNHEQLFKITSKNYLLKNGTLKNISSIENYIEQQYLI